LITIGTFKAIFAALEGERYQLCAVAIESGGFSVDVLVPGGIAARSVSKRKMQSEEEIIAECKNGKPSAQEKLYQLYSRRMMAVCSRYTKSSFEAEDIFHEAFVKVFKSITLFKGEGSFEGWMRRIFVNTAITHYNRNRKYQQSVDYHEIEEITPTTDDVVSHLSGKELMVLINQLPEGYKLVFNLYVVEGYNHNEIAEMLNIAESSSRSQLSKAKEYLKKVLQKHSISGKC